MPLSCNLGTLTSSNYLGHPRPVTGMLHLFINHQLVIQFATTPVTFSPPQFRTTRAGNRFCFKIGVEYWCLVSPAASRFVTTLLCGVHPPWNVLSSDSVLGRQHIVESQYTTKCSRLYSGVMCTSETLGFLHFNP